MTDNENLEDRMDEDNFRRGPATFRHLEPADVENVSKKARVARNVLRIRGEDNVKFDVNEEVVWENFVFHGISDCVNVHFVEVKRVCLGKERRWGDVAQGYPQKQHTQPLGIKWKAKRTLTFSCDGREGSRVVRKKLSCFLLMKPC